MRLTLIATSEEARDILAEWCRKAGIEKHITWSCARLSFSILLQEAQVDCATVSLLLGHKTMRHVGCFRINPCEYASAKANKNKVRKSYLEAEDYIRLLKTPCLNEEVRDVFIFCCYTGLRWCDVEALEWKEVRNTNLLIIVQVKTLVENTKSMVLLRRNQTAHYLAFGEVKLFYSTTRCEHCS